MECLDVAVKPPDHVTTDRFDQEVRAAIARSIRDRGRIPTIVEIADQMGTSAPQIDSALVRLIDGHVFIPRRGSHEIYAYNPFCSEPTDFSVDAAGREWSAICGWDALGIPAALGTTGTVRTHCGDGCGEPISIEVGPGGAATGQAVFHNGVRARHSWDDIYFT
ncbi:MAG: hypothetical protein NVSMB8_08190 [Candidatus Limnocylindrales bacterium]